MAATPKALPQNDQDDLALQPRCRPLEGYELHGWTPDVRLSDDENYMDIVMLLTRTSKCRQGSMGCIIVDPSKRLGTARQSANEASSSSTTEEKKDAQDDDEEEENAQQLHESLCRGIIAAATNASLFQEGDSDIHAEVGALGQVCRDGVHSTRHCTIYVTMAPCKRCFAALFAAGIHRVVTMRLSASEDTLKRVAQERGMILAELGETSRQALMQRIQSLVCSGKNDKEQVKAHRERRKEERRARKKKKRKSEDVE